MKQSPNMRDKERYAGTSPAIVAARKAMLGSRAQMKSQVAIVPSSTSNKGAKQTQNRTTTESMSSKSEIKRADTVSANLIQKRVCTFLDLPKSIRSMIYRDVWTVSRGWVSLDGRRNLIGHPELSTYPAGGGVDDNIYWKHDTRYISLSRTCRAINKEITHLAFSENYFELIYLSAKDLTPRERLMNLRPSSIGSLTYLVIRLNPRSQSTSAIPLQKCNHQESVHSLHKIHPRWHAAERYTEVITEQTEDIVYEWIEAARYMALFVRPYNLTLRFSCDTDSYSIAKTAVFPFMNLLKLKSCSIRVSHKPIDEYKALARKASLYAMGTTDQLHIGAFRFFNKTPSNDLHRSLLATEKRTSQTRGFMQLPKELRLMILKYTDLLTPLLEVHWTPSRKFHLVYQYPSQRFMDPERTISACCFHEACKFRVCQPSLYAGCFCRRYHGAYSAECRCWEPPTPIFLVCKQLRLDALEIFFKSNRFIVTPDQVRDRSNQSFTRTEAHAFLCSSIPTEAFRFINYLQIAMRAMHHDFLDHQSARSKSWVQAIEMMSQYMNIDNMVLEIYLWRTERPESIVNSSLNITESEGDRYYAAFQPLKKLRGIKDVVFHIRSGQVGNPNLTSLQANPTGMKKRIDRIKEDLEWWVLGDSFERVSQGRVLRPQLVGMGRLKYRD